MKAAIYTRVSTEDQKREGTSLQSQLEACRAKVIDLNYELDDDHVFSEVYYGLNLERPQLNKIRQLATSNEIKCIIVYSPDRLARVGEDILALVKEFKIEGVKLVFIREHWEDTHNGKLAAFMIGWASELEAAQIRERTMRGKLQKACQGRIVSGSHSRL